MLVELRAAHLERLGKMSRYGPLAMLEFFKCGLLNGLASSTAAS
jgi:hypothetical protein